MTRLAEKGRQQSMPRPCTNNAPCFVSGSRRTIYPGQRSTNAHHIRPHFTMPYSYTPANPTLHRGGACLECRRRKLLKRHRFQKCDGIRPICGCCQRGKRATQCNFDPPEGRVFALQQRIYELEESIRAIESRPRRSRRGSPESPSNAPEAWFTATLIDLPASVDWSPDMAIDSPALSFEMYEPSSSGPLRQGRSTQDWLFNTPLSSLVGPVETDPLSAFALLARMPPTMSFEPATVSLLSSPMHDFLIASFMARRREYGLQIDEESFLTSFALPPDHPSAVRPALRNAVYLLACHALSTRTPALAQYESLFVDKVRQGIANSLETAQEDSGGLFTGVILASILLARYLLIMGRIREAYHQTASVARFAISCGLHQLSTLDLRSHSPGSRAPLLLPPPTDFIALGERIHAFWAIYNLDRTISAVAGLPSTFGDDGSDGVDARERITTLWPRPLREYRSPEQLMHTPQSTISDYFSNVTLNGSVNRRVMNPGVHMLEAQAVEIHHRAHEAIHRSGADSGTSTRLFVLGRSALDLLRDAPPLDYFDDNDSEHTGVNPFIVKALALAYASQLKILLAQHGRAAYGDPAMHQIGAQLAGLLRRAQPTTGLDILVGVCCAFTLGFLKRASGADQVTEQLEKSLAYLRSAHVVLAIIPKRTRTSRIGIYHELGGLRPELGLLTVAPRVPLDYLGKRNPA
ncbi:GAL4-like Zn(II)2Cys6 (or C6 zinc) binuclear cluster DNA-binding domain [Rhizoctonia solani]|uniref:GAL4-like Zn(II)2Cys6 (Or C6 zinc) binuclear cluster DNA-binding domain n=1 Tax=Rhizoctonia solani TaxID=456999 RepID=A0A8H7H0L1_9AGAM|nr:GAL4-like Zn(II)2Cys6 (or C6 zinc) binuclear cluster DNA-binding domain [Rhizoctonia solani]